MTPLVTKNIYLDFFEVVVRTLIEFIRCHKYQPCLGITDTAIEHELADRLIDVRCGNIRLDFEERGHPATPTVDQVHVSSSIVVRHVALCLDCISQLSNYYSMMNVGFNCSVQ